MLPFVIGVANVVGIHVLSSKTRKQMSVVLCVSQTMVGCKVVVCIHVHVHEHEHEHEVSS